MLYTARIAFIVLLTIAGASPLVARADFPGAASKEAYTDRQWGADNLNFERRRFIDTYNAVGSKNPAWDALAREFLEKSSQRMAYGGQWPAFQPDDLPTAPQLARLGEQLLAKGCDDPQVRYCYACALTDLHRDPEAAQQLRFVFQHIKTGPYPPESVVAAAGRLRKFQPLLKPGEDAELKDAIEANCLKMATVKRPRKIDSCILLDFFEDAVHGDRPLEAKICKALRELPGADPWLVEVACGQYEINAAWDARGADLAFKVSPKGWQGFAQHLAEARTCLTKAWQLDPALPGSARRMITVVMGDGAKGNETARTWFDRALQAKFDDGAAADALFWALRPRWGGSMQQMLNLGLEAADTQRYDTMVPAWLLGGIMGMADEMQDKAGRTWGTQGIRGPVEKVLEEYEKALPAGRRRDWFRSWHAAILWRIGDYADACKQLDQLTTLPADDRFAVFTKDPALAVSECYALAGPQAQRARWEIDQADSGKPREAAKAFAEMAAAAKGKSTYYFQHYATTLNASLALDDGKWVDALPKGSVLHLWDPVQGDWSIDEQGRLVGKWDESGLLLRSKLDLGRKYEVKATFEYHQDSKSAPSGAGLALDHTGETYGAGLFVSPRFQDYSTYVNFNGVAVSAHIPKSNEMDLQFWDGRFTATLNGKPLKIPAPQGQILKAKGPPRLALYSLYPGTSVTVYVTSIEVRKLKETPAELKDKK